ncbi:MAG: polysaccharide deacetylase family protein [Roseburia sp.]|nr:polysaccharide deacetylase family protein [Muribaculum sp.]MCM1440116.1 polysaccharide deacetylase family protein [Roseburia sp.]
MNILTFDVEEWFHLLDNSSTRSEKEWVNYEVRIHENMDRIFRILEDTNTRATFFVIGWIAKTYPEIVRKIAEKYDVGSHTMSHQLVWQQSPEEFRRDTESSIKLLEDITGKKVKYFRAPGFSIRKSEAWAFETLSELGIEVDCSVFPSHHAHGGIPQFGHAVPKIICHGDTQIKELPIGAKEIKGHHIIFSGGGYFRLLPYWMIKRFSKESKEYLLSYIHPRDLDPGQPMIAGLPLERRFKSYVGLKGAESKFRKWLTDFNFIDIHEANSLIDWGNVPKIKL